jgi:hypothetical protein
MGAHPYVSGEGLPQFGAGAAELTEERVLDRICTHSLFISSTLDYLKCISTGPWTTVLERRIQRLLTGQVAGGWSDPAMIIGDTHPDEMNAVGELWG